MSNTTEPETYGRGKTSTVRGYAAGAVGDWVERALPHFGPGAPRAAWLGVCANGGVGENTTGWVTGDAAERVQAAQSHRLPLRARPPYNPDSTLDFANTGFHELGPLGVEGGPAHGLAPGRGEHDSWLKLAIDDSDSSFNPERIRIRAALGRNAVTAPGSWVAVPDSIVLGMANNCRCARRIRADLPAALQWPVDGDGYPLRWSSWSFAAATMGWSAGVAGARHHLSLFVDQTARVPEGERWGAWLHALAQSNVSNGRANHGNPFYSAIRTAQKFEAAVIASEFTHEPDAPAWLRAGLGEGRASVYAALVRGCTSRGSSPGGGGSSGSRTGTGSSSSSGDDSADDDPSSPNTLRRIVRGIGAVIGVGAVIGIADAGWKYLRRVRAARLEESEV